MNTVARPTDLDLETTGKAARHLLSLQKARGDWEGEVVWCPLITAQSVIVRTIVGRPPDAATRQSLVRHFEVTRTAEGAWGLHRESRPYVYVTTLVYIALRLLGPGPEHALPAAARRWLQAQPGGVLSIPGWGKFWLALLGLWPYEHLNPCPPELFLLPEWLPFHPSRFYCHTRHIYLAMAYLYGSHFQADLGPILRELRGELYEADLATADYRRHRLNLASSDVVARPGLLLRMIYRLVLAWERAQAVGIFTRLRRRALEFCLGRILYEQRATRYQGISPVSGLLNCLAIWSRDPHHPELQASLVGLEQWRWQDEAQGLRYAGARSNAWDTSLAMQALLEVPSPDAETREAARRAYRFLRETQLTEQLPDTRNEYRDPVAGGWCFSNGEHRWPVSDCTAEALLALLKVEQLPGLLPPSERMPPERLRQAVEFILFRQNQDGGFSTYERCRGPAWLEKLNPAEMFAGCMVDHSYVECTSSCVRALARYRAAHPGPLDRPVSAGIERGVRFLRKRQRADGSWAGSWGINFTYATFFAVEGLLAGGVPPSDLALQSAAEWLVHHQREDGGWGEHYSSCLLKSYREHAESQVEMTSWAVLALQRLWGPDSEPVRRGVAWLRAQQQSDGSWAGGAVNGSFFGTAMLDYLMYRIYFPLWVLARQRRLECDRGAKPVES